MIDEAVLKRGNIWYGLVAATGAFCTGLWLLGQFMAFKLFIRLGGGLYLIEILASWRYELVFRRMGDGLEFDEVEWPRVRNWLYKPLKFSLLGALLYIMFPPV